MTEAANQRHRTDRPGLDQALDFACPRDTLIVWRLGRSLRHLLDTVALLQERAIGFRSLQEQIDTTTSGGAGLPRLRRAGRVRTPPLIRERTHAVPTPA